MEDVSQSLNGHADRLEAAAELLWDHAADLRAEALEWAAEEARPPWEPGPLGAELPPGLHGLDSCLQTGTKA